MAVCCKEIDDYILYYESNKEKFNEERKLLIENIVKPTIRRNDIFFDSKKFYDCINFVELWFYPLYLYQKFVTAFLFMYENDMPLFRTFVVIIGRGNGKDGWWIPVVLFFTTELYGIRNYNVDIIANSESQAEDSYLIAYNMFDENKQKMLQHFYWNKEEAYNRATNSRFKFFTSNSGTSDGKKPGLILMNEYHAYLSEKNVNTNASGLGKISHPRKIIITSDGLVRGGPLDELKSICKPILNGEPNLIRYFPFICKLDNVDMVDDPNTWIQSNPSIEYMPVLKDTIMLDYLEQKSSPSKRPEFLAKRMNLPQQDEEHVVTSWKNILKASFKDVEKQIERDTPTLNNKMCICGIDFASLNDFATAGLLFDIKGELVFRHKTWVCSNSKFFKDIKFPFNNFGSYGFTDFEIINTPTINEELIIDWVIENMKKYRIKKIVLDSYKFQLLRMTFEKKGICDVETKQNPNGLIRMVRYPASIAAIVAPQIEADFLNAKINIGNSAILRWAINNTACITLKDGNMKYVKIEPKLRKNDPFMAFVVAYSCRDLLEEKVIYV